MTTATATPVGPPIEVLTRRLLETPSDFLAAPVVAGRGVVDTAAVVSDLLVDVRSGPTGPGPVGAGPVGTGSVGVGAPGGDLVGLDPALARGFRPADDTPATRNWLSCVLVAVWLLHEPALGGAVTRDRLLGFLTAEVQDLAGLVAAPALVADPDRREELARRTLRALGVVPGGETDAQAVDRLASLDSVERAHVLAATRAAEQRAAEVREALHAQRAAEAAAKASRE